VKRLAGGAKGKNRSLLHVAMGEGVVLGKEIREENNVSGGFPKESPGESGWLKTTRQGRLKLGSFSAILTGHQRGGA